jgi:hypothetical protein
MTCNANNEICDDYLGHNSISKTGKKIIFNYNLSILLRYLTFTITHFLLLQ